MGNADVDQIKGAFVQHGITADFPITWAQLSGEGVPLCWGDDKRIVVNTDYLKAQRRTALAQ